MAIEAGWYPDPILRCDQRYHDGSVWTDHVVRDGEQCEDPLEAEQRAAPLASALPLTGKGVTGRVTVDQHFVTINRKGALAKANYGFTRGEKRIPIGSIAAVQFKAPGAAHGYIQFTIPGGNESSRGIMKATKDENSVLFGRGHNGDFTRIRDYIERRLVERHQPAAPVAAQAPMASPSASDRDVASQLRDLAALRADGILTDEEFDEQKRRLLM